MMLKGIAAALAGAILLAAAGAATATAARADGSAMDRWVPRCTTDAMTDKQSCALIYLTAVPGMRAGTNAAVNFVWVEPGKILLTAGPTANRACWEKPTMLRVDKNTPVTLKTGKKKYMLKDAAARGMAVQFKAGIRAVMRVYIRPQCKPIDLTVTLKGFTAAWKRFEAAGR